MRVVKLLMASIFHHLTRLDSKRNYTKRSIGLAKFAGRPLLGKKYWQFYDKKIKDKRFTYMKNCASTTPRE